MTARFTAKDVRAALLNRYRAPEWATFFEVQDSTGAAASRSADAIAMSLYPSRGLRLHGFEIKVSRSDWLHELKQPDKSVALQRYCDHWWIVTPADIVREGELPPTWGHLILKGNGLNCAVKAPLLEREQWSPNFLAALLRRAHEARERGIREGVDQAMANERAAIADTVRQRVERELSSLRSINQAAARKLEEITAACGMAPDQWINGQEFGAAVALVYQLGVTQTYSGVAQIARLARQFADKADAALPRASRDEADAA